MSGLGNQIFAILCAAMVVSLLTRFAGESSTGKLVKLVGGLFLSLTIVGSLLKLDFDVLEQIPTAYLEEADGVAEEGEKIAREEMGTIIKEETETYILDKAKEMDVQIQVEVTLDQSQIPAPHSVRIAGEWTNADRDALEDFLEAQLSIPKERQQWISGN